MNRHRFEPARLLLGVLLAGTALMYVMDALGEWRVPAWLLPAVVPAALLASALTAWATFLVRRRLRRRGAPPPVRGSEGMPMDDLRERYARSGEDRPGPAGPGGP